MGLRDHVICDSDLHVMEPPDLWERYIDPAYAHAAPVGLGDAPRHAGAGEEPHPAPDGQRPARNVEGRRAGWRPEHDDVYADSQARGWDAAVAGRRDGRRGTRPRRALPVPWAVRARHRLVEQIGGDGLEPDYRDGDRPRLQRLAEGLLRPRARPHVRRGNGGRPRRRAARSIEARRCVEELGFKAIFLPPAAVNRRPWHHPAYDPLWAEIERLGVPLAFHGGGQTYLTPDFGLEVLDELMLWHTFSQPLGIQFVTVCLCGGGVLERFPDLQGRVARGQLLLGAVVAVPARRALGVDGVVRGARTDDAAVGVLQAQLLDLRRGRRGDRAPLRRDLRRRALIFSTDYPHGDSKYPHAVERLRQAPAERRDQGADRQHQLVGLYDIPLVKKV